MNKYSKIQNHLVNTYAHAAIEKPISCIELSRDLDLWTSDAGL